MSLLKLLCINSVSLIFIVGIGISQNSEEFQFLKKKYSGFNYVLAEHKEVVKIDLLKGVPLIVSRPKDKFVVLNQNGVTALSDDEIQFSSFDEIGDIEAYSLIPEGKTYKKVKAINFSTKNSEHDSYVFHDDNQTTSFMYPALCEGAYRILEYTDKFLENRFPFNFNFSSTVPIEKSVFIIDCDSSIHLLINLFNRDSTITYKEELIRNRRIMTWTQNSPVLLKAEDRSSSIRYYAPHLLGQISYYHLKDKKVNIVETAQDLHSWYKSSISKVINEEPSDELKQITDSISKNKNSEIDKVKSVYYWVQNNIKYIAFEEGVNGYIPRQPNLVINKRYGDCKDMASLIYAMLKYIKVESYLTWIGTREIPYKYSEFPSAACDNHMIVTFIDQEKQQYFLDATSSFQSFRYPTHGIQGKEAFLHISNDEFKIVNVPIMKKEDTHLLDSTYISIDNKKIIGKNKSMITGFYNFYINSSYDLEQEKLNKYLQDSQIKGNNTFKVSSASVKNLHYRDSNLYLNYDFEINNYVTSYDNEVYINMVLDKNITNGEFKLSRIAPFELASLSFDKYVVILDVPKGFEVKSIPKNDSYNSDFVDYSIEYKMEKKDKLIMTTTLKLKELIIYPELFPKWNDFVKVMKSSTVDAVVLQKK